MKAGTKMANGAYLVSIALTATEATARHDGVTLFH